jgi:formylglycine-generating enzyme required for sulfatase activity
VKAAVRVDFEPVRLAARHLKATFGRRYPQGDEFLARLARLEAEHKELSGAAGAGGKEKLAKLTDSFAKLRREALLANPLVDFDKMLVVKRGSSSPKLGLVQNWQSNACLPRKGYDDEIATLSGFKGGGPDAAELATLYRPDGRLFVGDVDLHWDADRMLFSMPGANGRWQVHEMRADGTGLRELPLIAESDVDNYDACYLPDGRVLFTSTAPFVGVPCVKGSSHVSNVYLFDEKARSIRRLTFEQDHDWCPTVMPNGRVLYLRWEYTDIPHYVSRILFHMNPDGTEQIAYYGSNSYWPNAMFYARPCPGSSSRFAAIVGGHHDVARMGELVLFDVAKGRREADGVVQRIPGRGKKVEPVIRDGLVGRSWPKFLHPWPLSDSYFIVSAKPTSKSAWGVYLVDVFDNMVLLKEEPGCALLEPVPLKRTPRPRVVPDRADPAKKDATVSITDVYTGDGLKGVPRGAVKRLRLLSYHFAYHGVGGQINRVGLDGPWDVRRIIGTVPVEPDGSACFRVPANTPIAFQPLDSGGRALQLMRSWVTAMPGEVLSCVGCHEGQNAAPVRRRAMALARAPSEIAPWYGPARGFSFKREVQPVLDRHCIRCHDGGRREDGRTLPDFSVKPEVHAKCKSGAYVKGTKFSPSYIALRSYVRGHTIESDIHMLNPCEFHADTTHLVRHLKKGHSGVRLDPEAWDRIVTWIDLNTPYYGTWHEIVGMKKVERQRDRRRAMDSRYAGLDEDPEAVVESRYAPAPAGAAPAQKPEDADTTAPACPGWPFSAEEARRRQSESGTKARSVDLGGGVKLELVRIPAGEFVMGDPAGAVDERPLARVGVAKAFWIGKFEVTNAEFARFDPAHDSRIEHGDFLQFSTRERGYPVNAARQPVCRVSFDEATRFCEWLSGKTGERITLPTEAGWEWACRAGMDTPLWYGEAGGDFRKFANLADRRLRSMDTFGWGLPSGAVPPWRPAVEGVDDRHRVSAPVGTYGANAWGLHDMAGNVWEWTRSACKPYPYREGDGRNDPGGRERRVVRGGSWYERPKGARSGSRLSYPPWQRVFDVGLRVVCED